MMRISKQNGVTMIELLIVLFVVAIIAGISIPIIQQIVETTRLNADYATVKQLNTSRRLQRLSNTSNDPFNDPLADSEMLLAWLFDEGYINTPAIAQSKNAAFVWDPDNMSWFLAISGEYLPLTPYGSSFEEIVPRIIEDISLFHQENNRYPRSWGDYRYTDLGLNPEDWQDPVLHIHYRPSGQYLFLRPEDGFSFTVWNDDNEMFYMKSTYNWNIIYNHVDDTWYFHTVEENNIINIETLVVELS